MRSQTDGRGIDVVLEMTGGGDIFQESLASLAAFGRLVVYGSAGQTSGAIDPVRLVRANQAVLGRAYSPKGQRHRFANISDQPAQVLCWITPVGLEQFFMEIGTSADGATAPPPVTDADIQKTIALAPQYGLTILPPDSSSH